MELAKIKVSGVHAAPVCLREIPAGIIGATVRFEYTDTLWDGLSKTVVFRGCVTKDVLNAGEVVTIPPEAVAKAGQRLYVGVYGTDTDENQAIPTLWADLGRIRAAADPSGDMSTDPTLPVWTQLQEQIDDLKGNGIPGGGGISQETDPTVPAWAKQPQKPTYTALEVKALPADTKIPQKPEDIGAQPSGNYALKSEIPSVPVQSVNGKTGAVKLSASDVGARPDNWMPTAQEVGALPSTYTPPNQTAEQVGADPKGTAASAVSQHNTAEDSHNDIRLELKAINERLTAFFDSDNQTLDELSEIVAYITSNKSLIDAITTTKVNVADIINNLTTNVTNKPLSAAQGVVLKGLIDAVSNSLANYQPKGNYALRSELPTVPTNVSAFNNDAGYLTQHQDISHKLDANKLPEAINTALVQAKASGEFDGEDGSDGFETITENEFAAITQENLTAKYADGVRVLAVSADENLVPTSISQNGVVYNGCGYMNNYRLNSSGGTQEALSAVLTGFMPYTYGKTIEIAGGCNPANAGGQYIATYDSNFALIGVNYLSTLISNSGGSSVCTENNEFIHTVKTSSFGASSNTNLFKTAAYIRVCLCPCVGSRLRVRYI